MTPAKLLELLARTGLGCALVDEGAGLLVAIGLNRSTMDSISVGLLESPNHVRSYFEATGRPGRTLDFDELCAFAEEKGLQLIHHCAGSPCWQLRPLGTLEDRLLRLPLLNTPACRLTAAPAEPGAAQGAASHGRPAIDVNQMGSVATRLYGQSSIEAAHRALPQMSEETQRDLDRLRESRSIPSPSILLQLPGRGCATPPSQWKMGGVTGTALLCR